MIKQSDVALIILAASLSLLISFFVGNSLINTDANRSAEIEKVVPIAAVFPVPPAEIFHDKAINPTQLIQIGGDNGQDPFETGSN